MRQFASSNGVGLSSMNYCCSGLGGTLAGFTVNTPLLEISYLYIEFANYSKSWFS